MKRDIRDTSFHDNSSENGFRERREQEQAAFLATLDDDNVVAGPATWFERSPWRTGNARGHFLQRFCETLARWEELIVRRKALAEPDGAGTGMTMQASFFAEHAPNCINRGFSPMPRFWKRDGERWRDIWPSEWSKLCEAPFTGEEDWLGWRYPQTHIALACGYRGLVAIDFDHNDEEQRAAILAALPHCRIGRFGSKGFALLVRWPGDMESEEWFRLSTDVCMTGADGKRGAAILEIKGRGRNITVPPSLHIKTGEPYRWFNPETGEDIEAPALDDLPVVSSEDLSRLRDALKPWAYVPPVYEKKEHSNGASEPDAKRFQALADERLKTYSTELAGNATGNRNKRLFQLSCALGWAVHHGYLSEDELIDAFTDAMDQSGYLKERGHGGKAGVRATIFKGLNKSRYDPLPELEDRPPPGTNGKANGHRGNSHDTGKANGATSETKAAQTTTPRPASEELYTEKSLAKTFAEENKARFRHVAKWQQWLEYTGKVWSEDETLLAFDEVSALCERASLDGEKRSKTLEAVKTARAVESFAKADRRMAAKPDQWDLNPWLLNTPGGVVDLRTGKVREHRASDYIRMIAGVTPDPCCPTPEWDKFLAKISGVDEPDQDWIDYMQRVAGYSTTGDVSLQVLFFGYGKGANGKGVFIKAVSSCLGAYHRAAGIETFVESQFERHTTELARLHGRRLVTVPETPPGKRWDEAKLKMLSGGDRVTARFMRKDDFEYDPQLKLFFSGNNKPGLRGVDEAWRRRFQLIPFAVTIPEEERDPDLFEKKLRPELPGILAWCIRGWRDCQENGLNPPQVVKDATAAYLSEQDTLGAWLEECCVVRENASQRRSQLWDSWRKWTEASNEWTGKKSEFWLRLADRGFEETRDRILGQLYHGLRLKETL